MASITIRNLEEDTKEALRVRAAKAGLSMEEYVRGIIREAVEEREGVTLGALIAEHFGPEKGVDLEPFLPRRDEGDQDGMSGRELPRFE